MKQDKNITPSQAQHPAGPPTVRKTDITKKRKATQDVPAPTKQTPQKRAKASTSISAHKQAAAPLPERLRPQSLAEFVGQSHLTGPESLLMTLTRNGSLGSMVLWGPPGYVMFIPSFAMHISLLI